MSVNQLDYPKTNKEFVNWYSSCKKLQNIYFSMEQCQLFDVSLRDGLQGLNKEQQNLFTLDKKIELYNKILSEQNPKNIEIGSIVSSKILPIMSIVILQYFWTNILVQK